jgi:hypothetical protein
MNFTGRHTAQQKMTPTRDNATGVFLKGMYQSDAQIANVAECIRGGIQHTIQLIQSPVWVDSHYLAKVVYQHRLGAWQQGRGPVHVKCDMAVVPSPPDPDQTLDYVQHLFREAEYVCRYAYEGMYLVHHWKECSPQCREHRNALREHLLKTIARQLDLPVCPDCFLKATITSMCPACEKDLTSAQTID